jgi:glutamate N-acetyltransferase/amino-acid N-acetyltransferase
LDDCTVVAGGERSPTYAELEGRRIMSANSFTIGVNLGRGHAGAQLLTCDLSYDYVRINAEYRT